MIRHDAVRAFLQARGCPGWMVQRGLDGLLAEWENTVVQVDEGYPLGLDDYLNDVDTRQLILEVLEVAGAAERRAAEDRLLAVDARMRELLQPVDECLWGDEVAAREGWSAERNWWYYALPRRPGELLREDLEGLE